MGHLFHAGDERPPDYRLIWVVSAFYMGIKGNLVFDPPKESFPTAAFPELHDDEREQMAPRVERPPLDVVRRLGVLDELARNERCNLPQDGIYCLRYFLEQVLFCFHGIRLPQTALNCNTICYDR